MQIQINIEQDGLGFSKIVTVTHDLGYIDETENDLYREIITHIEAIAHSLNNWHIANFHIEDSQMKSIGVDILNVITTATRCMRELNLNDTTPRINAYESNEQFFSQSD